MKVMKLSVILFYFVLLILYVNSTSSKNKKDGKTSKKVVSGVVAETVEERGLVVEAVKWKDIVDNHQGYHPQVATTNTTLAYVTPWNNHGYDVAKWHGGRFSHVSPVWLQLRTTNPQGLEGRAWEVTGLHDVDEGWMKDVRAAGAARGAAVKLVPRLLFEGWRAEQFQALVDSPRLQGVLAQDLVQLVQSHNFDGLVLEVWSQLPSRGLLASMPAVLARLTDALRDARHTAVLVLPPPLYQGNAQGSFQAAELQQLVDHVDFFSLMTYDYSSLQNPGPNSPLWWVQQCVETLAPDPNSESRRKLLVGLNLYGLEHTVTGGRHLLGPQHVENLAAHKPKILYDDRSVEHYYEYRSTTGGKRTVFYPSLLSVRARILLARNLRTAGVALWEVGQGLDYFYDLL